MHLQTGDSNQKAGTDELGMFIMISQDVTNTLAQKTFDTFSELLDPVNILLLHSPGSVWFRWLRSKRRNGFVNFIIPGDICDQILDNRKGLHRLHCNRIAFGEFIDSGHTHQFWKPIYFSTATATSTGFAVPTTSQIWGLGSLKLMNSI